MLHPWNKKYKPIVTDKTYIQARGKHHVGRYHKNIRSYDILSERNQCRGTAKILAMSFYYCCVLAAFGLGKSGAYEAQPDEKRWETGSPILQDQTGLNSYQLKDIDVLHLGTTDMIWFTESCTQPWSVWHYESQVEHY